MREEKFATEQINGLCQMHDEVIDKISVQDGALVLDFAELIHPVGAETSCEMIFRGFEDMDADVRALVYDMDGELKPSRRRVLLQIDAKELVYRWQ